MQPSLVHYSETWNRALYVAIEDNRLHYIVIVKHPIDKHLCCYLNLPRTVWDNAADDVRADVTYEGIGSDILNVPAQVISKFPLEEETWWIGFDYYQKPAPTQEQVLECMLGLIRRIYVTQVAEVA